jgi:hypothetical protein
MAWLAKAEKARNTMARVGVAEAGKGVDVEVDLEVDLDVDMAGECLICAGCPRPDVDRSGGAGLLGATANPAHRQ